MLRRTWHDRTTRLAGLVLAGQALVAVLGPLLWPHGHLIDRSLPVDQAPSLAHPLGTTRAGHDVVGQVLRGLLQSLRVGVSGGALAAVIGVGAGLVAGWRGGRIDAVVSRLTDVVLTVPALALVLIVSGGGERAGWLRLSLVIGGLGWPPTARVVRAAVRVVRGAAYVQAARGFGASDVRILGRHVLPNVGGLVVVAAGLSVVGAVLVEATISYLGLGIRAPDVSLGSLVAAGQGAAFTRPWLFYGPGLVLVVLGLSIVVLSDGLRDALDAPSAGRALRDAPAATRVTG